MASFSSKISKTFALKDLSSNDFQSAMSNRRRVKFNCEARDAESISVLRGDIVEVKLASFVHRSVVRAHFAFAHSTF